MKRQSGFTLIELVVVIVILGILAATAAPKFMNLQGDARISALNGLKGAVKSAVSMTYSKAILKGIEKTPSGATVCSTGSAASTDACSGDEIDLVYGRPAATENGLIKALDIEAAEVEATADANDTSVEWNYFVSGDSIVIFSSSGGLAPKDQKVKTGEQEADGCNLVYKKSAGETAAPEVTVTTKKC